MLRKCFRGKFFARLAIKGVKNLPLAAFHDRFCLFYCIIFSHGIASTLKQILLQKCDSSHKGLANNHKNPKRSEKLPFIVLQLEKVCCLKTEKTTLNKHRLTSLLLHYWNISLPYLLNLGCRQKIKKYLGHFSEVVWPKDRFGASRPIT